MSNVNRSSFKSQNLVFYPAYCHAASQTHFTWVKLTASEVHHALKSRSGFEGQHVYFYLNHPVQFICLVGVVVAFEDYHEKRWLLTLDDSSGETIDIVCNKPSNQFLVRADGEGRDIEAEKRTSLMDQIELGSVIKVKGTITTFRDIRQIHLERVAIQLDTEAEVEFWKQRLQTFQGVLSKPWRLSKQQQKKLQEAEGRAERRRERSSRQAAREEKDADRIVRYYEKEEQKRAQGAEVAKDAALRLQKSCD
ncbi:MAG: hypothetical protein Q9160_003319 [Pyrenula sp. 1 TL-2023]